MADAEDFSDVKSILSDILGAVNSQTEVIRNKSITTSGGTPSIASETIALFREMNINLRAIMGEVSLMRKVVEGRIKYDPRLQSETGGGSQYRMATGFKREKGEGFAEGHYLYGSLMSYADAGTPGVGAFRQTERTLDPNNTGKLSSMIGDPRSPFAQPFDPDGGGGGGGGGGGAGGLGDGFKRAISELNKLSKELSKLVDSIRNLQQRLGITAGAAVKVRFGALAESVQSYATTLITLGSRAAVNFKEIETAVSDFRSEFGGLISREDATELAKSAKEMGVTTQQLAAARRVFMTQTMGDLRGAQSQQERFIKVFTKQGMTSKDAMEFIGKNSELLARSGIRFQQSMAKAAGEAKKIGVDLSKVNQVGDNIIGNFEGFLESMAELGAMGFNFDATRLAEIAERGDPGELLQELRSQLRTTGRDLTDLTRSQQLRLSSAFGMDISEFQRMAGETPGVGEEESPNRILENAVNFLEGLAGSASALVSTLSFISTVLAISHTFLFKNMVGLLKAIAAKFGAEGTGKGIFATIKEKIFGAPKDKAPKGTGGIPIPSTGDAPGAGTAPRGGMLERFFGNVKPSQLLAAGAAMIMVAGATFILAKAFQEFGDVTWPDVALGLGSLTVMTIAAIALGKAKGPMMEGAFAVALLSASLIPFAYAMSLIAGLDIKSVLAAASALVIFGGAVFGLGALMATGAGAALFGTGLVALAKLGAVMAVFGAGLLVVSMGMKAISSSMSHVEEVIDSLVSRVGGIFKLSFAVAALAGSLLLLGTLGKSAIPVLLALAAVGVGFGVAKSLTGSISKRKEVDGSDVISRPGYGDRTLVTPTTTVALNNDDNIVAYADDMISTNSGVELLSKGAIIESSKGASEVNVKVDLHALEKKLDQVISAMSSMQVVMDGNKVGRVIADNEDRANTMGIFQTQRVI
jgi:hypothetical protein